MDANSRRHFLRQLAGASMLSAVSPYIGAQSLATECASKKIWTLIGDFPHTKAFRSGLLKSPCVDLDIAPFPRAFPAFSRTVAMEFDVSELSLVTFLQARAAGRKLSLLPAVTMSRFQHPYLVYNSANGVMTPKDLEGARIGVRLFTSTTASWLRGILANEYDVDVTKIKWLAHQQPNVPEWTDPPYVTRVPEKDLSQMLFAGEVDALVVDPVPTDPRIKPIITDPMAAMSAWQAKNNAIQINHMMVVKDDLTKSNPAAVREIWRMLKDSKRIANESAENAAFTPFGVEANRRNIEILVNYMYTTGMIPRRFAVDELFNDVTRELV
jgi:4,5-dihydroxyphthalate decarboxylase